jgi:hypothetical protein
LDNPPPAGGWGPTRPFGSDPNRGRTLQLSLRIAWQEMNLGLAEALWFLGDLRREDLPGIALEAMQQGVDSLSLHLLAGLSAAEMDEAWDLFAAALEEELGRPRLGKLEQAQSAAVSVARSILAGDVPPAKGAWLIARISWQSREVEDSPLHQERFRLFIGLWSQWEDWPEGRTQIEEQIVSEAKSMVESWGAPTG